MAVFMACQHGRELNGTAAIARAFERLSPAALRGTVVLLPLMNPVAARMHAMEYPVEAPRFRPTGIAQNVNMNRMWPRPPEGSRGTYAAAVAEAVWSAYVRRADVVVDLHGWSGLSLSLAWSHQRHRALLRAFGLPWHLVYRKAPPRDRGLVEDAAQARGIPWITCELAPQNEIRREAVDFGCRGILNVLKFLGLIPGTPELPPVQYEFDDRHEETVIKTPAEGLLVSDFAIGDWVRKGETVLRVRSLNTLATAYAFRAPHDALVFNIGGTHWGEDTLASFVVYPGQVVGLLKKPTRILKHA
jgi:predicted deacylase